MNLLKIYDTFRQYIKSQSKIKVLTWNMLYREDNTNELTILIRTHNPDIIALQEVNDKLKNLEFNGIIYNEKLFNNYNAILTTSGRASVITYYKKTMFKLKFVVNSNFGSGRPISIVVFENLYFINLHLSHANNFNTTENKAKIESNDSIKRIVTNTKYNIIVAGDFNENIKELTLMGKKLNFTEYTGSSFQGLGQIDQIFSTGTNESGTLLDKYNSDHYPLLTTICL
jgi:exonuclease III